MIDKGNIHKLHVVRSYFKTMMNMFKTKGNCIRNYANKKLSERINKKAQNIFQDQSFSHGISSNNGILKGLMLRKSIKKFKQGAETAKNRGISLNICNFENSIKEKSNCDSVSILKSSNNNFMSEQNNSYNSHDYPKEISDQENPPQNIIIQSREYQDETPSINSLKQESNLLDKMKGMNTISELKLLSFLKNKY